MITQERLKEMLHYDPETGVFVWKSSRKGINAGQVAGCVCPRGYRYIHFEKLQAAHRLAFLYMTGSMPKGQVDHINGKKDDNRWVNLRDVPRVLNQRNMKRSVHAKGLMGVNKHSKANTYTVKIGREYVGCSTDFFEACCLRKSAELKNNYHPNHGRSGASER